MFNGLNNLLEIDLSDFDFSKIKSMNSMFKDCINLRNIYFGNIDTSSVEDMSLFLFNCKSLSSINLSNFDTSLVTTMQQMFSYCENIRSIDASSFNTSKVTIMFDLFAYCYRLVSVNVSSFDTSNVENIQGIFFGCIYLKNLDLQNFRASNNISNIKYMFGYLYSLVYLNLRNFKILNFEGLDLEGTFIDIPETTKYCIEDIDTRNFFNKSSDCSYFCFQNNTKFNIDENSCTCNENNKFIFNNECYNECPNDKYPVWPNINICSETHPDNYYLDNDKIYKECYNTCKTCNKSGNETNHNCDECINNYIFLNESSISSQNCYRECQFYYYIKENNQYNCTESNSCPEQYPFVISEKRKCIDECKNDDEYIYTFNSSCFRQCPNNLKIYEDQKLCLESCYNNQFEYKNKCYNDCPLNTSRLFQDKKICVDIVPENYYLDNIDNIYKECYNSCKTCNQSGNESNNNCNECNYNYTFLNHFLAISNNCYKICDKYYYFDENNQHKCIESCPSQYNKLIKEKNNCIDECIKDDEYIYEYNNYCLKKCPNNTKTYEEGKKCLESCYDYQFEYNNICYNNCPNDTNRLFQNRNICSIEIPENYFLDDNDNIYKECYNTCKICSNSGNEIYHNCNICKDDFTFINESLAIPNNCYLKCNYNYYFTHTHQYFCTESDTCPEQFNILIFQKNKCIDKCKNDDEYKYNYNNICMKECPINTTIYFETNECKSSCTQNQFEFNNIFYNEFPNHTQQIFEDGIISIQNNSNFDNLMNKIISEYIPEQGKSLIIQTDDDSIFHVTNSKNELELLKNISNNINNISIIDLGECETILRTKYNISENDPLIFIKQEKKKKKASEKQIDFDVYEPYNKTKLNLSFCDGTSINLLVHMELGQDNKKLYERMKESGYDMFNINDQFYQDICTPFDSSNGTDILLTDRIDYIYNNEDTQCQSNCKFSFYSIESRYMNCSCFINKETTNENRNIKDKFSAKKIYESFYDVLKYSNYKIIKCFKLIFHKNAIIGNYGCVIVILLFIVYLICLFIYAYRGIIPLKIQLRSDINNIQKIFGFNDTKFLKPDLIKILNPPLKKDSNNKLILNINIERKKKKKSTIIINNKNSMNSTYMTRKNILEKTAPLKLDDPKGIKDYNNNISKDGTKYIKQFDDYELNEMKYIDAINLDKRSIFQIYWSTLKREHLIVFTFINCTDYNLLVIKLARFIFLMVGDMAFNSFFFSDDSMHKLYINYGKYDFIQQIPQIVYSTIFSQLIEVFLCFLSLTDKHIYQIKLCIIEGKPNPIQKIIRCIHYKLIIFFLFTFIFYFIYWYIICVFCTVYRNTQIAFIKDSIISFSFCLIYPFLIYLFTSLLRICSLRYTKGRLGCLYKLSYILPFF